MTVLSKLVLLLVVLLLLLVLLLMLCCAQSVAAVRCCTREARPHHTCKYHTVTCRLTGDHQRFACRLFSLCPLLATLLPHPLGHHNWHHTAHQTRVQQQRDACLLLDCLLLFLAAVGGS